MPPHPLRRPCPNETSYIDRMCICFWGMEFSRRKLYSIRNTKGLLAIGCNSTLLIADVTKLVVFQTLDQHQAAINLVSWCPETTFIKPQDDSTLKCASSDIAGTIVIWNVLQGKSLTTMKNASTIAIDLKWFMWQDTNRDFLLVLHSNHNVILWNSDTGEKIWTYPSTSPMFKFSIDPFDSSFLAFSSSGSNILLLNDAALHRPPTNTPEIVNLRSHDKIVKETSVVQIQHHEAYANLVFVLFQNEVFLLDVTSKQVIYSTQIDANTFLCRILPCAERDAYFLVNQNAFVSLRVAKTVSCDDRLNSKLTYARVCYNEAPRLSVKNRVMGACLCPITQSSIAMLLTSGKVLIYELRSDIFLYIFPYRLRFIKEFVGFSTDLENIPSKAKFTLYGIISSLNSTVTTVRMRPMDKIEETGDRLSSMHLAAIGTNTGVIHLVDVFKGKVEKSLQIHSFSVKCLEWGGPNMLISTSNSAYSTSLSAQSTIRNDVFATDIRTGRKKRIRPEAEESPIELIRVSFYLCYLAISFRNEPLEIWDLKSMKLLRRMSRKCPIIVDMAWSGKHHNIKTVSETNIYRENLVVLDNENHLYHVVVKGLHVRDGKEWKASAGIMRCMVWKDDFLAFGDSIGRINVWDLSKKSSRQVTSSFNHEPVQRCVFSRLSGDTTLAVMHASSIVIWDAQSLQPIQRFNSPSTTVLDMDLCGVSPIYITSNGTFHHAIDTTPNSAVLEEDLPALCNSEFNTALLHSIKEKNSENLQIFSEKNPDIEIIQQNFENLSHFERISQINKYLGHKNTSDFIEIAYASKNSKQLSPNLLEFWSTGMYRKRLEEFTKLLMSTCKTVEQIEFSVEKAVILGKHEWATYVLLNTEQANLGNQYRLNAYKSCLLTADLKSEESQCLIKLTATNLIAANYISDGIQLLCLIDQCLDACKYLISNGMWKQAISYAKINESTNKEILLKWVDYLINDQISYKSLAILVLASLGEFDRCAQMLNLAKRKDLSEILVKINQETS